MHSFKWDDNYLTGIETVDAQHHHLVDLINRLGDELVEGRANAESLGYLIGELKDYTVYHFTEEERLMSEMGVDARHVKEHRAVHHSFLTAMEQKAGRVKSPDDVEDASSLLDYLVNWLAFHILGEDKNLARQIEAIRSGTDPSVAYDNFEHSKDVSKEPLLAALHFLFDHVSQQNRELLLLNEHLEELVAERTAELSDANRRLEEIAYVDSLTGLPNRRSTVEQLKQRWEAGGKLSCLMIDADHFKAVNDTYGHSEGDLVLKTLARTLQHSVRSDDIVGRMGGDEFLVVCSEDSAGALQLAEKLIGEVNALEISIGAGEGIWSGSVSVGYAERRAEMNNIDDLIKQADEGVYLAKKAGKNCVKTGQPY